MKSIKGIISNFPNGKSFATARQQNPVKKVDMRWRPKEDWKKLLKQARQNANKNVYDNSYVRE